MLSPKNISLYRAIQVPKTPEGLADLKSKGITMSNRSDAQYKDPSLEDELTSWDEYGGNPGTRVDGLPVFLNMSEAVSWMHGGYQRTSKSIPIIAHAALPLAYFQPREGGSPLISVQFNDLHGYQRAVPPEKLLEHSATAASGYPRYPEVSINSYRGEWGEHFVPRPYPIDQIMAAAEQEGAPPGYTKFYTPSYHSIGGKVQFSTGPRLSGEYWERTPDHEVDTLKTEVGELIVPRLVEVSLDPTDDQALSLNALLDY